MNIPKEDVFICLFGTNGLNDKLIDFKSSTEFIVKIMILLTENNFSSKN